MHKIVWNRAFVGAILMGALLSGCGWLAPARPTVEQGNIISVESVRLLKVGMSKEEVITILGSPVLTNLFEQEQWHYVYSFQAKHKPLEKRGLTVIFKNDRVISFETAELFNHHATR